MKVVSAESRLCPTIHWDRSLCCDLYLAGWFLMGVDELWHLACWLEFDWKFDWNLTAWVCTHAVRFVAFQLTVISLRLTEKSLWKWPSKNHWSVDWKRPWFAVKWVLVLDEWSVDWIWKGSLAGDFNGLDLTVTWLKKSENWLWNWPRKIDWSEYLTCSVLTLVFDDWWLDWIWKESLAGDLSNCDLTWNDWKSLSSRFGIDQVKMTGELTGKDRDLQSIEVWYLMTDQVSGFELRVMQGTRGASNWVKKNWESLRSRIAIWLGKLTGQYISMTVTWSFLRFGIWWLISWLVWDWSRAGDSSTYDLSQKRLKKSENWLSNWPRKNDW